MDPQHKTRRQFSKQFKAETVGLIRSSGKSVPQVCRDLDLAESVVRRWLAQADIDDGRREGLTTAEREELTRLRRENRVLREERDTTRDENGDAPATKGALGFWCTSPIKTALVVVRHHAL